MHNIRTPVNSAQEFISELKKNVSMFEYQSGVAVDLNITGVSEVADAKPYIWLHILNILREALNNIRKHANARNVRLTIQRTDKQVFALVKDDGVGFCSTSCDTGGFGLGIMQERASFIGGKINIISEIGKGTQVILTVPLRGGESECR
jgi:signal transduction histidine kinase